MSEFGFKVTSDSKQAQQDLAKLNASVNQISQTTEQATRTLSSLAKTVTAAFASLTAFNALNKASDSLTNLENRIALVTGRTRDLVLVQKELVAISVRARGTTADAAEVFTKFGKALSGQGISNNKLLIATEAVQKAIAISGTSAESASAAIVQLGQGLASGTLRGEELNSVLEQAPRLAQAIADGLGVGVGQLRQLAEAGRITSDKVFKALVEQSSKINDEFKLLNPTFQQATSQLGQSIQRVLGEFAKATGSTTRLTKFILNIADGLNSFSEEVGSIVNSTLFTLDFFYQDIRKIFNGIRLIFENSFVNLSDIIKPLNLDKFLPNLDGIAKRIQSFGSFVRGVFYRIWDEVVGHSTWPDTINGIINWGEKLAPGIKPHLRNFSNLIDSILSPLERKSSSLKLKLDLEIINRTHSDPVERTAQTIIAYTKYMQREVSITLRSFGKMVKDIFISIWDELVGHSIWPDTINGIIDWSKELMPKASVYLSAFKDYVLNLFDSIRAKVSSINIKFQAELAEIKDIGLLEYLKGVIDTIGGKILALKSLISNISLTTTSGSFDFKSFTAKIKGSFVNAFNSITSVDLKPFQDVLLLVFAGLFSKKLMKLAVGTIAIKLAVDSQSLLDSDSLKKAARSLGASLGRIIKQALSSDSEEGIVGLLSKITGLIAEFGRGVLEGAGLGSGTASSGLLVGLIFGTAGSAFLTGNLVKTGKLIYDHIIKPLITGKESISQVTNAAGQVTNVSTTGPSFLEKLIFGPAGASKGSQNINDIIKNVEKNTAKVFIGTGSTILATVFGNWVSEKIIQEFGIKDTFSQIGINIGTALIAGFFFNNIAGKLITAVEGVFTSASLLGSIGIAGGAIAGALAGGFLGEKVADFLGITDPMQKLFFEVGAVAAGAFIGGFLSIKVGARLVSQLSIVLRTWAVEIGAAMVIAFAGAFGTGGGIVATVVAAVKGAVAALATFLSAPVILATLGIAAAGSLIYYIFFGADENSIGGKIRSWFKSTWDDIASGWSSLVERIKNTRNPFTIKPSDPLLFPQGPPQARASGGSISGPGTGTSDSILARLSNGEYVINAKSTKKYRGLIEAINSNQLPGYVSGGFVQSLRDSEGFVNRVYTDTMGHLTVGIGHKLTPDEISRFNLSKYVGKSDSVLQNLNFIPYTTDRLNAIFNMDLARAIQDAAKVVAGYGENFDQLPVKVQDVLADMSFQLGGAKLAEFKNTIPALLSRQYEAAAEFLKNSANYRQTPNRVNKRIQWLQETLSEMRSVGRPVMQEDPRRMDSPGFLDSMIEKFKGFGTEFKSFSGKIFGQPGTDQIPALVSSGEFIVNEEDAKKNEGLLKWINSGLPAFQYGSDFYDGGVSSKLNQAGINTNDLNLSMLSRGENRSVIRYLKAISEANLRLEDKTLSTADYERNILIANKSYAELEKILDRFKIVDDNLSNGKYRISAEGLAEGTRQAEAIAGEMKTSLSSYLKGQQSFAQMRTGFYDNVTNKIIDSFASGFINKLTEGFFSDTLRNMIGGVFDLGSSLGGFFSGKNDGSSMAKAMWVQVAPSLTSSYNSLIGGGNSGTGLLGGIANAFQSSGIGAQISASVSEWFKPTEFMGVMDSGGIVPGHMTGAVPILAHAGEVILNESQQARVASAMLGSDSQQVVNINITGDISRQTRQEILSMGPKIADIVQAQFQERRRA